VALSLLVGELLGYARVSTTVQDPALQHDALSAAGCWRTWTDTASGSRSQLAEVMAALRPGDTLTVWRLDRLGRSLPHLIETVPPGGRLVFHIFGSLAEFESDLIRSRTVEGMREAAKRGRLLGKPSKLSVLQRKRLLADYESGEYSAAQLMDISGLSRSAMYATLNRAREEQRGCREHR